MMAQVRTLLRVKELKLEQAERAMMAKRQEVEEARGRTREAEAAVAESVRTYAAREDAIYQPILGEVIDLGDVDETNGKVVQLGKDHATLEDALERARHVEARLEEELQAATGRYNLALRSRDKFTLITDELAQAAMAEAEQREEVEIEDLFARPRKKVA